MIKIGDTVKIVKVHKKDAYYGDKLEGSLGIVLLIDNVHKLDKVTYYTTEMYINSVPEDSKWNDNSFSLGENSFYFAYVQLRKVRKSK